MHILPQLQIRAHCVYALETNILALQMIANTILHTFAHSISAHLVLYWPGNIITEIAKIQHHDLDVSACETNSTLEKCGEEGVRYLLQVLHTV